MFLPVIWDKFIFMLGDRYPVIRVGSEISGISELRGNITTPTGKSSVVFLIPS
jgi:hypothetical protein